MTYVIASACVDVKDRACIDERPTDCIYEGKRMLYIHPDECVDCGACEPVCPAEDVEFTRINADLFTSRGSPGRASGTHVADHDHPDVTSRPVPEGVQT